MASSGSSIILQQVEQQTSRFSELRGMASFLQRRPMSSINDIEAHHVVFNHICDIVVGAGNLSKKTHISQEEFKNIIETAATLHDRISSEAKQEFRVPVIPPGIDVQKLYQIVTGFHEKAEMSVEQFYGISYLISTCSENIGAHINHLWSELTLFTKYLPKSLYKGLCSEKYMAELETKESFLLYVSTDIVCPARQTIPLHLKEKAKPSIPLCCIDPSRPSRLLFLRQNRSPDESLMSCVVDHFPAVSMPWDTIENIANSCLMLAKKSQPSIPYITEEQLGKWRADIKKRFLLRSIISDIKFILATRSPDAIMSFDQFRDAIQNIFARKKEITINPIKELYELATGFNKKKMDRSLFIKTLSLFLASPRDIREDVMFLHRVLINYQHNFAGLAHNQEGNVFLDKCAFCLRIPLSVLDEPFRALSSDNIVRLVLQTRANSTVIVTTLANAKLSLIDASDNVSSNLESCLITYGISIEAIRRSWLLANQLKVIPPHLLQYPLLLFVNVLNDILGRNNARMSDDGTHFMERKGKEERIITPAFLFDLLAERFPEEKFIAKETPPKPKKRKGKSMPHKSSLVLHSSPPILEEKEQAIQIHEEEKKPASHTIITEALADGEADSSCLSSIAAASTLSEEKCRVIARLPQVSRKLGQIHYDMYNGCTLLREEIEFIKNTCEYCYNNKGKAHVVLLLHKMLLVAFGRVMELLSQDRMSFVTGFPKTTAQRIRNRCFHLPLQSFPINFDDTIKLVDSVSEFVRTKLRFSIDMKDVIYTENHQYNEEEIKEEFEIKAERGATPFNRLLEAKWTHESSRSPATILLMLHETVDLLLARQLAGTTIPPALLKRVDEAVHSNISIISAQCPQDRAICNVTEYLNSIGGRSKKLASYVTDKITALYVTYRAGQEVRHASSWLLPKERDRMKYHLQHALFHPHQPNEEDNWELVVYQPKKFCRTQRA